MMRLRILEEKKVRERMIELTILGISSAVVNGRRSSDQWLLGDVPASLWIVTTILHVISDENDSGKNR